MKAFWGLMVGGRFWSNGVAACARDGCRQERERERDRQPPSDPFSKNKETMDEG